MAHTPLSSLLLFGAGFTLISGNCNTTFGPAGGYECVKILKYNNVPQWATCLTNTYIKTKSRSLGKQHFCENPSATYCYYQCMCESYDNCNGPDVNNDCSCDPNNPQKDLTTASLQATLPPWCFSPDGKTCSWYRDCLEERYPCEETNADYAITYAEKFCDLYSDHYRSFSSNGQQWVNAVRKCLQVELVPVLRPWVSATCSDIKSMAFSSHSKCYTSPSSGVSFCSLDIRDMWEVFWTIKGAFADSFVETMNGIWDTINECLKSDLVKLEDTASAMIHTYVAKQEFMEKHPDKFAGEMIDLIAAKENWKQKGLTWFGYNGSGSIHSEQEFRIDIILASRRDFDLNAPTANEVNVTETVMTFANSIRSGGIRLTVEGANVHVLSMSACVDFECNSTFIEVVASVNGGTRHKMSSGLVLIFGILNLVNSHF